MSDKKKTENNFNVDGTKGHYSEGEFNGGEYNTLSLG